MTARPIVSQAEFARLRGVSRTTGQSSCQAVKGFLLLRAVAARRIQGAHHAARIASDNRRFSSENGSVMRAPSQRLHVDAAAEIAGVVRDNLDDAGVGQLLLFHFR